MIVEQAIFGLARGGHGLRGISGNSAIAAGLESRLDLPDTAPPGVDWSPFVVGFPHHGHFVFARSYKDPSAPRSGMVLSHALIAPLADVVLVSDLRPLFNQFIHQAIPPRDLVTLDLDVQNGVPPVAGDLAAAAAALSTRGSGPVVRLGTEGFDDLVISLWANLWPAVRRTFAFRLSFGPADLVETPSPALICTPSVFRPRWRDHRLVDASIGSPVSLAAKLLCGDREGKTLLTFAEAIGSEITELSELPLLEQAYRFMSLETPTMDVAVAGVRLVERLSPIAGRGTALKVDLLDRVVRGIENATAIEVMSLRNLTTDGFEQSSRLWAALERWAVTNTFPPEEDQSFRSVLVDAASAAEFTADWRRAIQAGLSGAARAGSMALAAAFWRWIQQDDSLVRPLWDMVTVDQAFERALVTAAPKRLSRGAGDAVLELARDHGLYPLHGVTVSALYDPLDAVHAQLAVDSSSEPVGIRLALRNATPRELLDCAITSGEPRVLEFAADQVAKTPALLSGVDLSSTAARSVWRLALERNEDAWAGPTEPRAVFDEILVDVIDHQLAVPPIVDRLSRTPLADLTNFSRRAELWPILTGTTRELLLSATAKGWIDRACVAIPTSEVEQQLQIAVLNDPKLDELLDQLANDRIGLAIQIVATLPLLDERRFNDWFRTAVRRTIPIPSSDAMEIGRLVQNRQWRLVVDELMHMLRSGREDVRLALRECLSMISWLDRWWHGITPVSTSNKWDSLEEVAAKLYPNGPTQNGLWERAGGSDADLNWGASGRTQWRDALVRIRNGSGGPRVVDLLREMQSEYSANDHLRFLAEDKEFGGWR
ncbi:GAP1-N1 domain-containing protein [Kribbella sp. WER1]